MINIKINNKIQKLYNKYELDLSNPIGSGSYSIVYMGRILDYKIIEQYGFSTVAIKKIKVENLDQKNFKLINDEITILEKIKNIKNKCYNIINCIEIIEEFDYIYIIMEYCENGDISRIIGKPIKESIVKYYFRQLINALVFLYENKIIHRDIKPKNILLKNNKKELVLCDFGFARIKSKLERINTICGSPLYMAPELLDKKSYTEGVDIWAIGMILYEMLYGEHPYKNCSDLTDLKEFSKKEITIPPHGTINYISDECLDLLKKMLNKEEKLRINLEDIARHIWFNGKLKMLKLEETIEETIEETNENSDTAKDVIIYKTCFKTETPNLDSPKIFF